MRSNACCGKWSLCTYTLNGESWNADTSTYLVRHFGPDGFGYASPLSLVGLRYLDQRVRSSVTFNYRKYSLETLALAPMVTFSLVPFPVSLVMCAPLAVFIIVPFIRGEGLQQVAIIRAALSQRTPEEKTK
jgi:hypothetical protein